MTARLQLELTVGGKLLHYPGPNLGRADGDGTVTIVDEDGTAIENGAATRGVATQALTATAEKFARTLAVTSNTAFKINRAYWLSIVGGLGVEVKVIGRAGSTGLELDQPIPFEAALTTSTIADHALEFDTTTLTHDTLRRNNVMRWDYTLGGNSLVRRESFDVVTAPFDVAVTEEDLERADPEFGERRGARRGWTKAMLGASDKLFLDLEDFGVRPEVIWGRALLRKALAHGTLEGFYRLAGDSAKVTYHRDQYAARLQSIMSARQWPELQGS